MKKWILGAIVGAIIVFAWQAASWMFLGIHDKDMKYHPAQKEIMEVLSANTKEDGMYMLPSAPTKKEQQDMRDGMEGKPWASIIYHHAFNKDMTMPMIRAFLVYFVLVLLLVIILTKGGMPGFSGFMTGSLAVGVFTFLWGPYSGHIWFDLPWHMISGDIIDAIVAWGLCGAWLGWWMNRK
ncbi:MAG: hypothetical protein JJE22_03265 [Bacteroidia bacterium]|nr:hypothetical protein [Bacteroidia bacterium]